MGEVNAGCRVAAGGLDRIQADELRRGRLLLNEVDAQAGRHFYIQLCGNQVAGKMRIDERACPCAVKISLAVERDGQGSGAGLAVTSQSQVAQNGVELAEVAGVEIDLKRGGADHGVRAQMAVGLQLAGGQIELELAQIDRAVALGIGGVDHAAGRSLPLSSVRRWSEAQQGGHGEGAIVAVDPQRVGRAVDARIKAEMLEGRITDHLQNCVQGHVFELSRHLAVDGNVDLVRGRKRVGGDAGFSFGRTRRRRQPVDQRNLALNLAALAQAGNNRGNQQLLGVGMNARIEPHAPGHDAGADVSAVLDVNAAVDAETSRLP